MLIKVINKKLYKRNAFFQIKGSDTLIKKNRIFY